MFEMRRFGLGILVGTLAFINTACATVAISNEQLEQKFGQYLLANLSPETSKRGCVIASPSHNNPDYFYHWVRDAALVMDQVVDLYYLNNNRPQQIAYYNRLLDYIDWVEVVQKQPTPSGSLAEPKFEVDGQAYQGPWGRPQSDGPALRAMTLIRIYYLLKENKASTQQLQRLYNTHYPADSMVKKDLEYVANHWQETTFDLWEEVRGWHFYTHLVQRKALLEGAKLATKSGDLGAAAWYQQQAGQITTLLQQYWQPKQQIIAVTLNRDDGLDYKSSQLDVAIILALLHAKTRGEDPYSFDSDKVLSTVAQLITQFKALYQLNSQGLGGIAIGRYPEDRYDGNGVSQGNPWNLAINALGQFYLKLAKQIKQHHSMKLTPANINFYQLVYQQAGGEWPHQWRVNTELRAVDIAKIAQILHRNANAQFDLLKQFMAKDAHLAEQLNRNSGKQQGASDLTWSYASSLSFLHELIGKD